MEISTPWVDGLVGLLRASESGVKKREGSASHSRGRVAGGSLLDGRVGFVVGECTLCTGNDRKTGRNL